ncbi:PulJ/GspJ family protein [Haliovirga abyssi]|uniref:Prepilin-type N-terminal cleavage/methylation domain-containing protein n=1 Tax=Haliovirga abyssi TaxID=2996794 RepID=A0AAU9DN74_9FUSO|nr:prepilin-type N-terminal cleavage/methylation domain-containing protein [Haliovirga abyssi]BDU49783.1 hypothetical protein HLVA_03520 [Haliovirga abyssi]
MRNKGFTLLEIIIAVVITGIVMGTAFSFFKINFSTWNKIENSENQEIRVFDSKFRADIKNMYYLNIMNENPFKGDYNKVEFYKQDINGDVIKIEYSYNELNSSIEREKLKNGVSIKKNIFFNGKVGKSIKIFYFDKFWKDKWDYKEEMKFPVSIKIVFEENKEQLEIIENILLNRKY